MSSWITNNIGGLGNLASRIAAEANGDTQQATNETIRDLRRQLESLSQELTERHQEWEQSKQNYEARLKSLTDGDATAQKVDQLEQNLGKAAGFIKRLRNDKNELSARIDALEVEKKEAVEAAERAAKAAADAEAAAEAAEAAAAKAAAMGMDTHVSSNGTTSDADEKGALDRVHHLEAELKVEQERNSTLIQSLKDQLSELIQSNTSLNEELKRHQEENSRHADVSTQLQVAKEELEQVKSELQQTKENAAQLREQNTATTGDSSEHVKDELQQVKDKLQQAQATIDQLKQQNAELADNSKEQQAPSEPSSSALVQELSDAKSTITHLEAQLAKGSEHLVELDTLKSSQNELQDALASVREELAHANAKHNEAQVELSCSKETNVALSEKEATMTASIAELGSQMSALKLAEAESIRRLTEEFEQEKRTLLANSDQLLQEIQELKDKYQEAHLQSTSSDGEASVSELKEQHEKEKESLLAIQNSLRQDLDSLQRRYDDDRTEIERSTKERESVILDLEQTITSNQQTITSNEQAMKTLREELQATANQRDHFQTQHKTLLDRLGNMKSAIGTKLQADMEKSNTLQKQIDQLAAQSNSYLNTIKQLEDELIASQDHYEKTSRELEHLRRRLVDIQEEASAEVVEKENVIHDLQSRLQREEREREDWETMASEQRASKDQAVMAMRAMERERDAARVERESLRQELERQIESLSNLEAVMEAFQSAKESDIQFALEGLQRQLNAANASLEEYRGRAQAAEEQLRHLTLDVEKARQLEREVRDKNVIIGKLRHEAVIQQGHLTEAMRRLKEENSQNNVDIPLISNLFISFLNIPRGDQKRFEILQLIAGVLKFTDEQREQAGLIRRAGAGLGALTPSTSGSRSPSMEQMRQHQEPRESFADMWASFLFRETSANNANNAGESSSGPKSPSRQ